jgi:hypothetical protein
MRRMAGSRPYLGHETTDSASACVRPAARVRSQCIRSWPCLLHRTVNRRVPGRPYGAHALNNRALPVSKGNTTSATKCAAWRGTRCQGNCSNIGAPGPSLIFDLDRRDIPPPTPPVRPRSTRPYLSNSRSSIRPQTRIDSPTWTSQRTSGQPQLATVGARSVTARRCVTSVHQPECGWS